MMAIRYTDIKLPHPRVSSERFDEDVADLEDQFDAIIESMLVSLGLSPDDPLDDVEIEDDVSEDDIYEENNSATHTSKNGASTEDTSKGNAKT